MEGGKVQAGLIQAYQAAARRALLLDYDGTLVPFVEDPKLARPDAELMDLLRGLAASGGNEVVIVSGRPRRDLEEWFGRLPVALIAEHGVWLRLRGGEWRMLQGDDRRLEGAGAADSAGVCGPAAGGVAGGEGVFARVALSGSGSGAGLAAFAGAAGRPGRGHAEH